MFDRDPALPAPPLRLPYVRLTVQGAEYVFRVPSLARVGQLLQKLTDEQRAIFMNLGDTLAKPGALLSITAYHPEQFGVAAACLGLCWADPARGLDTPTWTEGDLAVYGHLVYEELHEAGWNLQHVSRALLSLAAVVHAENALTEDVLERTAFFRLPRVNSSESESQSSADSSAATPDGASTN